jgi:hypothetical protein
MRYVVYALLGAMLMGGVVVTARAMARQSEQQEKSQKEYEEEMEEFTPSESVPADSAISFPTNI